MLSFKPIEFKILTGKRLLVVGFLFIFFHSTGQTRAELEEQRNEAQRIIENTSRLLQQTSRSRITSTERLNILNQRLISRRNLISTLESEVKYIDNAIEENRNRIEKLELELSEARDSYAELIRLSNRHRSTDQLFMFILSAETFNQAYRRFRYIQQYNSSRKRQIERIRLLTDEIISQLRELEENRTEKIAVITRIRHETEQLAREREEQNIVLTDLQKREDELRRDIESQRQIARSLENAIQALIKEEIGDTDETIFYTLTPEEKIISDEFRNNRGGLPWPTERGVVTGFFGEHPHPVLRGITIQNNGIDISTPDNAEVRSIFNGQVRSVISVPGANNVIIIRHGNFLTVYSNLSHVYVRQGDQVSTKQLIGRVFTDNDNPQNRSFLHVEIWEENNKLDPLLWLSRQ